MAFGKLIFAAALAFVAITNTAPAKAQSYDMDCKVILCMAGGFPSGCGDAYSYMIDRITNFPNPKPPFGICTQSDGTAYDDVDAPYAYLNARNRNGWHCPDTHRMFFRPDDDRGGRPEVFCYTHATTRTYGRDDQRTTYHGRISAQPLTFQVQVTVEPGTSAAYTSPLYRLNYRTGFVTPTISQ